MAYWLMKSEPEEVSIVDLETRHTVPWFGVRNYQARNFMRDAMQIGDLAFFTIRVVPSRGSRESAKSVRRHIRTKLSLIRQAPTSTQNRRRKCRAGCASM